MGACCQQRQPLTQNDCSFGFAEFGPVKNYPVSPFSYVSYYRDYQKDSTNYLNLNESIIQTLDNGFDNASDSNMYRLLDFKKNMDFPTKNVTPYYDLPEADHSDIWS